MTDCLNEATCSPKPSQAFPAPLPAGIPADVITYAFDGDCPQVSGLDSCTNGLPGTVTQALDKVEDALCSLNPKGIKNAPDCSPVVVKNGIATPVTALQALNCLPDGAPGDVPIFNGSEWVIGPILLNPSDCEYPCPPAADLILRSTGANTATWQSLPPSVTVVADTSSVDLTVTDGVVSGVVKIDPASVLSIGPNGLTATLPTVVPLTGTDTPSVDLTITGNDIKATVIVDPVAGNALVQGPNGLSVAVPKVDCAALAPLLEQTTGCFADKADSPVRVLSSGPSGVGYRNLPSLSDLTTVSDTNTLDLVMTGANVIGNVKVDPVSDNKLVAGPNGLSVAPIDCAELDALLSPVGGCYSVLATAPTSVLSVGSDGIGYRLVPTVTPTTVTVADTATVDLTIGGTASNPVVSGVVKIDPAGGNKVAATASGLFVGPLACAELTPLFDPATGCFTTKNTAPTSVLSQGSDGIGYRPLPSGATPTIVSIADTPSIDLTLAGTAAAPVISGVVKIDPVAGNALVSGPNGLSVTPSAGATPTVVSIADTATVDLTLAGTPTAPIISGVVKLDPIATNKITATASGLLVAPLACTELLPLFDPATGCFTAKNTAPTSVLSVGSDGIGYRPLPSGATPTIVGVVDTPSIDLTLAGTPTAPVISGVVKIDPVAGNALVSGPNGLSVAPSSGGTATVVGIADTATVDMTLAGTPTAPVISGVVKLDPAVNNLITATANGLLVVPTVYPVNPTVCAIPDRVLGQTGAVNEWFVGRELYHAEAYPISATTVQTLSNVPLTLNDVTSLMQIAPGDESGLCGAPSFWDPALSRFTITRPGRYQFNWSLFVRLIAANGNTTNSSLYSGMRFIRPAGVVDGRSVSNIATTLRGSQMQISATAPAVAQDYTCVGSHTFIATAGTQLSLRVVFINGTGGALSSLTVKGDSGHFSLSELPLRSITR